MGPNQKIVEEEFEQSEDVVEWDGGTTDFSFDDNSESEPDAVSRNSTPEPEEL